MTVLLITYDISGNTNRSEILEKIKIKFPNSVGLSESSYAVSTTDAIENIRQYFSPYIRRGDKLYVITLTKPWGGHGEDDVKDWLNQYLP